MGNYFYTDDDRLIINKHLLVEGALKWACRFLQPKQKKGQRNPKLTSAQLRNFYHEAKKLEEICKYNDNPDEKFKIILPLVKMLKSKVAYACPKTGRDRKVPVEFKNFIDEMVDNVKDWKDFKAFALSFEAVVGYFYGLGGR